MQKRFPFFHLVHDEQQQPLTFICHVCDVSWVFGHKTLRFAQLLTHKGSIPIRRDPAENAAAVFCCAKIRKQYVLAKTAQSDLLPHFYLLVLHFFTRKSLHFIQTLTDKQSE